MFGRKFRRFFYLSYNIPKLLLEYNKIKDQKNSKVLREFGIHLREKLKEMGPTFIKFGQMLSLRFDILHPVICKELRKLLDHNFEVDFGKIRYLLEKEYNLGLRHVFKEIDNKPFASASIAQVHKAKLKSGEKVVVKVRKPGIKEKFKEDIDLLYTITGFISKLPKMRTLNLPNLIKEFEKWSEDELNFVNQAKNMKRFKENLSCFDFVVIPDVHWDLTKENVLVYDYLDGLTLNEVINSIEESDKKTLKKLEKMNIDLKKFVVNYPKVLFKQTFDDGYFNADPHPANVILMEDNNIGLIDFGMVGELTELQLSHLFMAVLGFVERDVESLVNIVLKIGKEKGKIVDINLVRKRVEEVLNDASKSSVKDLDAVELFYKLFTVFYETDLELPIEFTALGKEFATLEGVADIIAPDYNLIKELRPVCTRMLKKEIKEKFSERKLLKSISHFLNVAENIPETINGFLGMLKRGKIQIVVKTETIQEKEDDKNLRTVLVFLLSVSLSLFFSIGGDLSKIGNGFDIQRLLIWVMIFPFVFTLLYILMRKK
jgi:ubiquinone biosynthesis protein